MYCWAVFGTNNYIYCHMTAFYLVSQEAHHEMCYAATTKKHALLYKLIAPVISMVSDKVAMYIEM